MYEVEAAGDLLLMVGENRAREVSPEASPKNQVATLVLAARSGDRDAFGRLYGMFAPMVHGILLARVPQMEVDDLVQDVFLLAFKKLPALRDEKAFGGWLAMITRNRAMDFYRRSQPSEEMPEEMPQKSSFKTEAAEALATIRALPDAYRETLVLRLVEGMTGPEIAERTGLTHDSVRVNLSRGMKLLREKLMGGQS